MCQQLGTAPLSDWGAIVHVLREVYLGNRAELAKSQAGTVIPVRVVPWPNATRYDVSPASFDVVANIRKIVNKRGPGVYTGVV